MNFQREVHFKLIKKKILKINKGYHHFGINIQFLLREILSNLKKVWIKLNQNNLKDRNLFLQDQWALQNHNKYNKKLLKKMSYKIVQVLKKEIHKTEHAVVIFLIMLNKQIIIH